MSAWWDEEYNLLLVTPEEYAELEDGTMLTAIDGDIAYKGDSDIDDDTRCGHMAWGVTGDHHLRLAHLAKMTPAPATVTASEAEAAVPSEEYTVWTCKIGVKGKIDLPRGADAPMRRAVEDAFSLMTARDEEFCFSGWGGELDKFEIEVLESMNK